MGMVTKSLKAGASWVRRSVSRLGLTSHPQRAAPFVVVACLVAGGAFIRYSGYFVNFTGSLPPGLYEQVDAPLSRGAIVQLGLAKKEARFARRRGYLKAGSCPGGIQKLGKHLVGLPGDTVAVTREAVRVNGRVLPNSRPLTSDSQGRRVYPKFGTHILHANEYFVFSGRHKYSYDSRYLGPVTDIRRVVRPVWVFD